MKMLKEERALRQHLHAHYVVATKYDRELSRLLTAFRRAVREDQRKQDAIIESETAPCQECADRIAAAIRRRGKR